MGEFTLPFFFLYKAMIQFDQLRILSDGTILIVEASVKDSVYYENVYIDSISIDNQRTYSPTGPSGNHLYNRTFTENIKSIKLEIYPRDIGNGTLNLTDNLFFVYIRTKGAPALNTPCGLDNSITLGAVYNAYPIYRQCMDSIKELDVECTVPKHLIDKILRYKALDLSILTGDYSQAIHYWNKFFRKNIVSNVQVCRCYDTVT